MSILNLTMVQEYYNAETKTLKLPHDFNKKLSNLPIGVLIIIFEEDFKKWQYAIFNQSVNSLPNTITHLTVGCNFNQLVVFLPNKLTHLTFGFYFNQSVNSLPNNLTHLTFGYHFNLFVDNLPKSLTNLTFGKKFNQLVNNLPNNLTHLTFGKSFNQSVDFLPNNLTHLTFGEYFNQSVNSLPSTLIEIGFSSCGYINNNIPNSIEFLNITFCDDDKYNKAIDNLPLNVKKIRINRSDRLHNLKKIPFGCKVIDKSGNEILL